MANSEIDAAVAAAEAYEALMVPALMQEWAPRTAAAAKASSGMRVLDVACGTGVVTRELLTQGAEVAAVDVAPGMLTVAERLSPQAEFHQASVESLPFNDDEFDASTCQFGLMFFPDKTQALREVSRVSKPGARCAVAVWDEIANSPGYAIELDILQQLAGSAAADAIRLPYSLGNSRKVAALLSEAGLSDIAVAQERGTARFPSIRTMVEADLRGWLPVMGVDLEEDTIAAVLEEANRRLLPFVAPTGSVEFDSSALIATGIA